MTSSNGNIFHVTGPLCGEFTGPGEFPAQRPVTRSFDVSVICARINGWVNNRKAGDLRRHRGHYGVDVMVIHNVLPTPPNLHSNRTFLKIIHTSSFVISFGHCRGLRMRLYSLHPHKPKLITLVNEAPTPCASMYQLHENLITRPLRGW